MPPSFADDAHLAIPTIRGTRLLGDRYLAAFTQDFWRTGPGGFWKLEIGQSFIEPSSASWRVYDSGDLPGGVALHADRREELVDYYRLIAEHGFATHRVRVVQLPLTPYLRWELPLLALRDSSGGACRVLTADLLSAVRVTGGGLPEVCVMGDAVAYRLLYIPSGLQVGGIRCTDPATVRTCRSVIQALFADGEPVSAFVDRELDPG